MQEKQNSHSQPSPVQCPRSLLCPGPAPGGGPRAAGMCLSVDDLLLFFFFSRFVLFSFSVTLLFFFLIPPRGESPEIWEPGRGASAGGHQTLLEWAAALLPGALIVILVILILVLVIL